MAFNSAFKGLIVACGEELQSLVTHLIYFTHRKIQVVAKTQCFVAIHKDEFYE